LKKLRGVGLERLIEDESAYILTSPQYFPAARTAPTIIRRREIKQLERTSKRPVAAFDSSGHVGEHDALHLAPNVGELLDKRERLPGSGRKIAMRCGRHQSITSDVTMRRICSWAVGSSTVRERLPCDGRTLIIESNSIQASSDSSG
jgi:hypothetical protein